MKDLKRYYTLKAKPEDVYNALTNSKMIEIWTGEDAKMQTEPNTEFELWNGSITGLNISFEENRKIVQKWYFEGQDEDSIVTILLHADKKGTTVELRHTNIPDEAFENISDGWDEDYFGSLRELFI